MHSVPLAQPERGAEAPLSFLLFFVSVRFRAFNENGRGFRITSFGKIANPSLVKHPELVEELPTEEIEDMVPVYIAEDHNEAIIVRSILEEAGIPVRERADIDTDLDIFAGPIAEEAIMVPVSRKEEAEKILEEARASGQLLPESDEETTEE